MGPTWAPLVIRSPNLLPPLSLRHLCLWYSRTVFRFSFIWTYVSFPCVLIVVTKEQKVNAEVLSCLWHCLSRCLSSLSPCCCVVCCLPTCNLILKLLCWNCWVVPVTDGVGSDSCKPLKAANNALFQAMACLAVFFFFLFFYLLFLNEIIYLLLFY